MAIDGDPSQLDKPLRGKMIGRDHYLAPFVTQSIGSSYGSFEYFDQTAITQESTDRNHQPLRHLWQLKVLARWRGRCHW